ncbi:MAG: hypothetical protein SGPRY_008378, partial [Prymnesium sp.]
MWVACVGLTREEVEAAVAPLRAALDVSASAEALAARAGLPEEAERAFLRAIDLSPSHAEAYLSLARLRGGHEQTFRDLIRADPLLGASGLARSLPAERGLEVGRAFAQALRAAGGEWRGEELDEWTSFVEREVEGGRGRAAKCVGREECIPGLQRALAVAKSRPSVEEGEEFAIEELRAPTVLRGGAKDWLPFTKWTAAYLSGPAGGDPIDVTVKTDDSFEVRPTEMIRPPVSQARLRDLIRLFGTKQDCNLTLYTRQRGSISMGRDVSEVLSRQAMLWSLPRLLRDLSPVEWMKPLRLRSLNLW